MTTIDQDDTPDFMEAASSGSRIDMNAAPVAEEAPAPVAEEAPAPVAEEAPAPVSEETDEAAPSADAPKPVTDENGNYSVDSVEMALVEGASDEPAQEDPPTNPNPNGAGEGESELALEGDAVTDSATMSPEDSEAALAEQRVAQAHRDAQEAQGHLDVVRDLVLGCPEGVPLSQHLGDLHYTKVLALKASALGMAPAVTFPLESIDPGSLRQLALAASSATGVHEERLLSTRTDDLIRWACGVPVGPEETSRPHAPALDQVSPLTR